jgi:chemotaxis methyl-accepting protein methylase
MIFQRNVVSYLEHSHRHLVLRHMTSRLASEGESVFEEARL